MTENLVQEVRTWLESLGYKVGNTISYLWAWQDNSGSQEFHYAKTFSLALQDCLEHFLKVELGRHWMIIWHETEAEYKLETVDSGNIASAIDYLFKLRELEDKSECDGLEK